MKIPTEQKINSIIAHIEDLCYNQCYNISAESQTPGDPFIKRAIPQTNLVIISKKNIELIYNLTLSLFHRVYGGNNEHIKNFQ